MRYLALASDYDGLASAGVVDALTLAALERLRALVVSSFWSGREVDDPAVSSHYAF
jgi:hypothetical protein